MRKVKRLLAAVLTTAMLATFLPTGTLAVGENETPDPDSEAVISENQTQKPEEDPAADQEEVTAEPEQSAPISLDDLDLYATVNGEKVYLEPAPSTLSLLPLEYHSYSLNLSSYFSDELKSVDISDLVNMLRGNLPSGQIAAWAKWGFYDEDGNYVDDAYDDDYTLLGDNATIDLSYGARQGGSYQMELIVGTADQLNPNNIRCRINVNVGYHSDLLEAEAYTTDSPRQEITIYDESRLYYNSSTKCQILRMGVDPDTWKTGDNAYLGLKLGRDYASFTAKAYEGRYETEDAIEAAGARDITDQILDQSNLAAEGGYLGDYSGKSDYKGMPEITLVLTRTSTGKTACVMPVILQMYPDKLDVYFYNLYTSSSQYIYAGDSDIDWNKPGFDEYLTCTLYSGYKADGTYYLYMSANDPKTDRYDADVIKGAYVGNYTSIAEAEAAGQTDIKMQLFSYNNRYPVDFSQYPGGIQFTVVDINDRVWHLGLEVKERPEDTNLPSAPTPLSADTYFRMQSALTEKDGSGYNAYVMKYEDDSYYYMGYQTVFLLDGSAPVTAEEITPVFFSGNKVNVYVGHDVNGATTTSPPQTSRESGISFTPGEPFQYSAAAETGRHLKNYFVTFLTQQEEPTIFVNGTNDESNYQEDPQDSAKKIPARVVNLTSDYNYRHDIFFANLGKDRLTGLKVELTGLDGTGEAQNVKLDDYWTIGNTTSLAGFTSTSTQRVNGTYDPYAVLSNVGKIRLVPLTDENGKIVSGQIKGLLTISADGVEPVRILLTGTAGTFQINTTKLLDGVKYVSYSSLIQTNYISSGSSNTDVVSFTASGLPNGIKIKPNGELYGIPTTPGTYEVTVTATVTVDGERKTDTKTYTMKIENNDDMNVWKYDQIIWGNLDYTPKIAIPNENYDGTNFDANTASSEGNSWDQPTMILETQPEGEFQYFIHRVFIDNVPLTEGVDYTSEDGSIKLTLQTQTLKGFGNGTHTISAEARIGDKNDGALRRSAVNYTLTTLGTNRPSGGGGSSSGSGGSGGSGSSEPATRYSITTADAPNGSVSCSAKSAASGTKITVTLTPDSGHTAAGLTVTRANGRVVSVKKISDTSYTFIMPSSNVTITPSFKPVEVIVPPVVGSFTDVRENHWFYDAVQYVFKRGLMVGINSETFNPNGTASRAMLVTVLYSLEGKPAVSDASPFSDVQIDQWFASPVIWAWENNLVSGCGDGTFCPNKDLSREQAAVILYNYAKFKGYDTTQSNDLSRFSDADTTSSYALSALQWANAVGLISGYDQDTLAPRDTATRAQLAVILRYFCENIVK